MPGNYYPDGFPMDPNEAIQYCHFLRPEEVRDWKLWLQSANADQQVELVDTLHSIYLDMQSTSPNPAPFVNNTNANNSNDLNANFGGNANNQPAAPFNNFNNNFNDDFSNSQNQSFNFNSQGMGGISPNLENNYQQNSQNNNLQTYPQYDNNLNNTPPPANNTNAPANANSNVNVDGYKDLEAEFLKEMERLQQASEPVSTPSVNTTPIINNSIPDTLPQTPFTDTFAQDNLDEKDNNLNLTSQPPLNEENFLNLTSQPYQNNPLLSDREDNFQNEFNNTFYKNNEKDGVQDGYNNEELIPTPAPTIPTITSPLQNRINEKPIQQQPVTSNFNQQNKEYNDDDSYLKKAQSSILSTQEINNLYEHFLDSQTRSASLQEEYRNKQAALFNRILSTVQEASNLNENVLKLNYSVVEQSQQLQTLKNQTQVKGSVSLQLQINSLDRKIDQIQADLNDFKESTFASLNEIQRNLSAALSDTYKADGILQKQAILEAKLNKLTESGNNNNHKKNNQDNLQEDKKANAVDFYRQIEKETLKDNGSNNTLIANSEDSDPDITSVLDSTFPSLNHLNAFENTNNSNNNNNSGNEDKNFKPRKNIKGMNRKKSSNNSAENE
jgi:hypothetical protein